jgi:hypothetical protein
MSFTATGNRTIAAGTKTTFVRKALLAISLGQIYRSNEELQADLDSWIANCIEERVHQGRGCFSKTHMQTFLDAIPMPKQKIIAT